MQIQLPNDTHELSVAAGFATVDQYIHELLRKDRERLAIQAGIDAMEAGHVSEFVEFDRDFRAKNGMKSR